MGDHIPTMQVGCPHQISDTRKNTRTLVKQCEFPGAIGGAVGDELGPAVTVAAQYRRTPQRGRQPPSVEPMDESVESLVEGQGAGLVDDPEAVVENEDDNLTMTVMDVGVADLDIDERPRITACVKLSEDGARSSASLPRSSRAAACQLSQASVNSLARTGYSARNSGTGGCSMRSAKRRALVSDSPPARLSR